MKLYVIIAARPDAPPEHKWGGSQADAAAARKAFLAEGYKRAEMTTTEVEVATGKAGLLDFLNLLASGPTIVAATERLTAK